ncbi:MAG: caspase family protein, partial [Deltaproteobacteria bacterium]|nr:caspase family protein [Deltaproteobacteria bacterium]
IGIAESKIGIADVLINGQHADIDEKGNFSIDVLLKAGKNDITVTAMDVHQNQVTKQFDVNREAGKVALVKKEEPVPETGFMSGKYHALLIAVQDYSNPEIGKLDYPVSDARQLMDVLSSRYNFDQENITLLYNPDRRTIYKTLQSMRKQLMAEDSLLIFYAGHGMWLDDMKQGFWLPRDAAGMNDPSDWIPNSNIRDYIKAIKAKHILLVADACFSGGIFKLRDTPSSPGTSMEKIYELPSRKAMTSGSLKTVPDQSVFVEFLIKRLEENKDPYLDAQKLFARMRDAVIHNSKTKQTPLYGAINEAGDEGGDFIFIKRQ